MKQNHILIGALICCVLFITTQSYNNHLEKTELQAIIAEKGKTIEDLLAMNVQLTANNTTAKENCREIVKGYALTVSDAGTLFKNIEIYYLSPERLALDASIILSRAERFMEKKNGLLEEMDIDVEELRDEVEELIERIGLKKRE